MPDVISNMFSVRDYNSFIEYLENEMKSTPDTEWLYSFKIIENTSTHDLLKDISKMEQMYGKMSFAPIQIKKHLSTDVFTVAQLKNVIKYD